MSHLVEPAELGAYGVFLSFTTIGTWVVYSGLTKFVGRFWANTDHETLRAAVTRTWLRKFGWLLAAALVAAAAVASMTKLNYGVILAAVLLAAGFLSMAGLAQMALQAVRENWFDLATSATGSLTRTFLPPIAYYFIGAVGLYAGFVAHATAFALVGLWCVARTMRRGQVTGVQVVEPIYEGPLFMSLALAGWILAGENRWLAALFFGNVVAGYFILASNIALIVPTMLGTILVQWLQPRFYVLGDANTPESRSRLARNVDRMAAAFGLLALAGVVAVRWAAPWLIGPLIDARYAYSLPWLVPVGCFGVATTTAGFYHMLLLAGHRERGCGPADLTTAGILTAGAIATSAIGSEAFRGWLLFTPMVAWTVTRAIARKCLFVPVESETPEPAV
ncbi:MAG TPA: hypothetical protein VHE61_23290 [Opitutaceae bacterium]|nr:hypothetical protein [Opitutaceae bacterium]